MFPKKQFNSTTQIDKTLKNWPYELLLALEFMLNIKTSSMKRNNIIIIFLTGLLNVNVLTSFTISNYFG